MSKSQIPDWGKELLQYHGMRPASLVSGGMNPLCHLIPQNVIVRVDSNSPLIPKETYIHKRMILKTILSGKLNAVIDNLSFPLEAGDSIMFFPFQFHSSIDAENQPKHSFVAISFVMPENDFSALLPLKNRILKLSAEDLSALKEIAAAFYSPEKKSHSQALLKLTGILLHQLEKVSVGTEKPTSRSGSNINNDIYDFIRQNFDKKLSLKTLAAEFGCSPENIRKKFQRDYPGMTPGRLIAKLQIQETVELLENSNSPIGVIAQKCGFSDTFTFSKKFKKIIGLSPSQYRARAVASLRDTCDKKRA